MHLPPELHPPLHLKSPESGSDSALSLSVDTRAGIHCPPRNYGTRTNDVNPTVRNRKTFPLYWCSGRSVFRTYFIRRAGKNLHRTTPGQDIYKNRIPSTSLIWARTKSVSSMDFSGPGSAWSEERLTKICFSSFEDSGGWDGIRVADYPLCSEEILETYRVRTICLD